MVSKSETARAKKATEAIPILVLILRIVASSMIDLGFSEASRRKLDGARIILYNYAAIVLVSGLLLLFTGWPAGRLDWALLTGKAGAWNVDAVFTYAILMALLNGFLYYITLIVRQRSAVVSGPGMTTLAVQLGVIVLSGATAGLWGETLTPLHITGLAVACVAFFFLLEGGLNIRGITPLVFLLGGTVEIVKKIYTLHAAAENQMMFYFLTFSVSLAMSVLQALAHRRDFKFERQEFVIGGALGVANLVSTHLVIYALAFLPASVVFPTWSGGVILLTSLAGALLFHEHFTPRKTAGLLLTLASLVLMNI